MRILVGTDNGLVKDVAVERKQIPRAWGTQKAKTPFGILIWTSKEEDGFLASESVSENSSLIHQFQITNNQILGKSCIAVDGIVRGMHYIPNTQTILVCSENGDFGRIELQSDSSKEETKVKNLFRVGSNVNRMRFFMEDNKCAAGGKENELSVWDINTSKNIWKARNVKDDECGLRVPVWITDLQFHNMDSNLLSIVTAYQQYRVYDTRVQRRPIVDLKLGTAHFTCLAISPSGNQVACGDTIGTLTQLDFRTGKVLGGFKGLGGSVRALQYHPTLPFLASCGLDRFLRVHSLHSRKLVHKLYLKQRLNSLLFSKELEVKVEQKEEDIKAAAQKKQEEEWGASDDVFDFSDDEEGEEEGDEDSDEGEGSSDEEDEDDDDGDDDSSDEEDSDSSVEPPKQSKKRKPPTKSHGKVLKKRHK